jgi:uncharacterized protein
MKALLLILLRVYQLGISPFLGARCRFYPSCSAYAIEAIDRYGALKGSGLAAKRLCKCHPWHPGGYDPVPGQCAKTETSAATATASGCGPS